MSVEKWIPINESLPDRYGWFIVTLKNANEIWSDVGYFRPRTGQFYWSDDYMDGEISNGVEVIAWKKLGEPYRDE